MASRSPIEWTDATWNPVTGCSKVSPGCKNCYAERLSQRLRAMGLAKYRRGFEVAVHEDALAIPPRWRKPRRIFVNSMSDLFHEAVPDGFIARSFEVMERTDWHTFQVLTKRPARAVELNAALPWPRHLWLGVSVESPAYLGRVDLLRRTSAAVKFVSVEPLLAPLSGFDPDGLDWVIVGGESGPGARAMHPDWVREIRDQCVASGVAFHFKQWGGVFKKRRGRVLDGRTWDETPDAGRSSFGRLS